MNFGGGVSSVKCFKFCRGRQTWALGTGRSKVRGSGKVVYLIGAVYKVPGPQGWGTGSKENGRTERQKRASRRRVSHSEGGGPDKELLQVLSLLWLLHHAERQCPTFPSHGTQKLIMTILWHIPPKYFFFAALTKNKKIGIILILTPDGYCCAGCCHIFI